MQIGADLVRFTGADSMTLGASGFESTGTFGSVTWKIAFSERQKLEKKRGRFIPGLKDMSATV